MFNEMIKEKGVAFYIYCEVLMLGITGLIFYLFANKAATALVAVTYVIGIFALIVTAVAMYTDFFGILTIIAPALYIAALVVSFIDNATLFALAANGVAQGTGEMGGPNVAFWVCEITILIAGVAAVVGSFFNRDKIKNHN